MSNSQETEQKPLKALEGVRVLDLTNVLAGPFATLHLALLAVGVEAGDEIEVRRDPLMRRALEQLAAQ